MPGLTSASLLPPLAALGSGSLKNPFFRLRVGRGGAFGGRRCDRKRMKGWKMDRVSGYICGDAGEGRGRAVH